ncbi:hypothetical protein HN873_023734 [Arachis hypogaea]
MKPRFVQDYERCLLYTFLSCRNSECIKSVDALLFHNSLNIPTFIGRFLAEVTKQVLTDLEASKYQMAEYRISVYGRKQSENFLFIPVIPITGTPLSMETPPKSANSDRDLMKKLKGFEGLAMSIGNGHTDSIELRTENKLSQRFVSLFSFYINFCRFFFIFF